ncbi:SH3 domain-containing protein [Bartonella sp. HY329]|uniref:SH3 domain-containing protein n=1 Tax=unclassified Bartonella TaxID=2645622 RepID=UPI0021C92C32|nr:MULTISPECIES: SH3 domain-containing protein [unclassified Bartonella]UXM95717.1 SH3 domain-containing protein [Bartonella sp. HY329]UXN10042.1 SH3 domain-containing protein [Bartonella sp. HY328]
MKRFLSSLLVSIFCLGAGTALAADAITTGNVNLRNGPSTRYRVQATLPAGYPININQCRANWCSINAGGYSGWISARYIAYQNARQPVRPYVGNPGPAVVMPFIIGGYGDYYYRNRDRNYYRHHYHRPPPPVYHRPPPNYHRPPPGFHRPPPPRPGVQRPPAGFHRPPPNYQRPPTMHQRPPMVYQGAPQGYRVLPKPPQQWRH